MYNQSVPRFLYAECEHHRNPTHAHTANKYILPWVCYWVLAIKISRHVFRGLAEYPLLRYWQIKGLAVSLVRRYPLPTDSIKGVPSD